jgi:zinc/manganese transport system permease protein
MLTDTAAAELSWNLVSDVRELTSYPFMVNALEAGTIVAVMAAVVGWFMVVRQQTFAGHTLSLVAFPGAAAASLAGLPLAAGYFGACALAALVLSAVSGSGPRNRSAESAAIGSVQAFALACGFLFVSLYSGVLNNLDALLFGTFLGVTTGQVLTLLLIAAAVLALVILTARRLLFASVDPDVARANGVPVGALAVGFLLVLGLAVAATSQITGALLVFALLVTPAATAQQITMRPGPSLFLSVLLALAVTWVGLGIAYFSVYPVGFWITSLSFGVYVAVHIVRALAERRDRTREPAPPEPVDSLVVQ